MHGIGGRVDGSIDDHRRMPSVTSGELDPLVARHDTSRRPRKLSRCRRQRTSSHARSDVELDGILPALALDPNVPNGDDAPNESQAQLGSGRRVPASGSARSGRARRRVRSEARLTPASSTMTSSSVNRMPGARPSPRQRGPPRGSYAFALEERRKSVHSREQRDRVALAAAGNESFHGQGELGIDRRLDVGPRSAPKLETTRIRGRQRAPPRRPSRDSTSRSSPTPPSSEEDQSRTRRAETARRRRCSATARQARGGFPARVKSSRKLGGSKKLVDATALAPAAPQRRRTDRKRRSRSTCSVAVMQPPERVGEPVPELVGLEARRNRARSSSVKRKWASSSTKMR